MGKVDVGGRLRTRQRGVQGIERAVANVLRVILRVLEWEKVSEVMISGVLAGEGVPEQIVVRREPVDVEIPEKSDDLLEAPELAVVPLISCRSSDQAILA